MELSDAIGRVLSGLLEARTGQQLSSGRHWRLDTALQPMLRARGLRDLDALVALLLSGRDYRIADEIVEALLNNETSFFRDPAVYDTLSRAIAQRLEADPRTPLRIWSAGCSTGQEVYSLAIMLAERFPGVTVDLIGTDVSRAAIEQAQRGEYGHFEIQRGLPIRALARWFVGEGQRWSAVPELRDRVRFEQRALKHGHPGLDRFDFVLCRNVMLYFSGDVRRAMFDVLASALRPDGRLLLGAGETLIGQTDRFVADRVLRGLYRQNDRDRPRLSTGTN